MFEDLIPLEQLHIAHATETEWELAQQYSIDESGSSYGWFFVNGFFYKASYGSLRPAIKLWLPGDINPQEVIESKYKRDLYAILDRELNSLVIHTLYSRYLTYEVPVCGDYVVFDDEPGVYHTVAHVWPESVQTSRNRGSLSFCSSGRVSRSGSLDQSTPMERLTPTEQSEIQHVWIFDKEIAQANGAVYFQLPFKVWQATGQPPRY